MRKSSFTAKRIFLALLITCVLSCLSRAEQLPIKTYTIADGLAHGSVVSIYQDRKGFLWFGSYEGLSRFDGYGFTNYDRRDGLPHVFINHITEDRQGRLWVATNGGVARLAEHSPEQGSAKFVSFNIRDTSDLRGNRTNQVNRMLFDGRGNVWCLTDYGLYRAVVNDTTLQFETIIEKDIFGSNAALEDADGTLWFGIADTLVEIRGSEITYHGTIGGATKTTLITGIARDRDRRLLVADFYQVCEFVPPAPGKARREWRQQLALPHQPNGRIKTLFAAEAGAFWLGTSNGLIKYADGKPSRYVVANGLPADNVGALATDRDGNLWIGTEGGSGVCQLISEAIVSYTRSEGLPGGVGVYEDERGRIWAMLPDHPVAEIVGGNIVRRGEKVAPLLASGSTDLLYSNRTWYQGGHNTWSKVDKPSLRLGNGQEIDVANLVSTDAKPSDARLYKDERGVLWIAKADRNLYRLDLSGTDDQTVESIPTDADYWRDNTWMIGDGAGDLWLGTFEKIGRLRNGSYAAVAPSAGLPETNPRAFFLDSRGWLWVGLRFKGVSVTREPAADHPTFINYSHEQEQLSSNAVRTITEDREGRLYFGTDRGLDRFDPNTDQWTHFSTEDGLAGNVIYKVFRDHNGFIWITSEGGISRFDLRKEKESSPPAAVYFSRLQVAGEEVRLPEGGAESIPPHEFASTQNNLTIAFVAPNYQDVNKLRYQYKLEGISAEWSAPTGERSVTFGTLAAGTYRFLARAIGENGVTSRQPAVFEFRILPPIYLRWWFIAASLLLAGLAIYLVYRLRVSQLLEIERTRTRIAADLHDDIGANLTKISILTEVAHQQLGLASKIADNTLSSIATISRESAASMRDIIWAINPKRDRLLDLSRRMRGFATDIFTSRDIEFRFSAPDRDRELKLSPEVRRDIFLIFKEAINNIVRHAECRKAEIELNVERLQLVLRVSDHGKGFVMTEDGDGHGFSSMRRRAENCGGRLEINSHPGSGTTICVIIPTGRRR